MNKIILSVFILGSFGFYTLWQSQNTSPAAYVSSQPVALAEVDPQVTTKPKTIPTIETIPVALAPKPVPVSKNAGQYTNGTYVGSVADAYYGNVQVEAIITNGQISNVQFLDYPQDRGTSVRINSVAMPRLTQEAIQAQSAKVDGVSGASDTSAAFKQSLGSALTQAMRA